MTTKSQATDRTPQRDAFIAFLKEIGSIAPVREIYSASCVKSARSAASNTDIASASSFLGR
jgi:hypothetical protein